MFKEKKTICRRGGERDGHNNKTAPGNILQVVSTEIIERKRDRWSCLQIKYKRL